MNVCVCEMYIYLQQNVLQHFLHVLCTCFLPTCKWFWFRKSIIYEVLFCFIRNIQAIYQMSQTPKPSADRFKMSSRHSSPQNKIILQHVVEIMHPYSFWINISIWFSACSYGYKQTNKNILKYVSAIYFGTFDLGLSILTWPVRLGRFCLWLCCPV